MGRHVGWTRETCRAEAAKYHTTGEFIKFSNGAYKAAHRNGWLGEVCSHMTRGRVSKWSIEDCRKEAAKYKSRSEFVNYSCGAYSAAHRNGWLDEICPHMNPGFAFKWNFENCRLEAAKYKTRGELQNYSESCYSAAYRKGWLDEICSHMVRGDVKWTFDACSSEAVNYKTRNEFHRCSGGAYDSALRSGWLDEICLHMKHGKMGFNPEISGFLYDRECIGVIDRLMNGVSKVGITNKDPFERSIQFGHADGYFTILRSCVHFEDGRLCKDVERHIKLGYRNEKYIVDFDGPKFLDSGQTEVFTRNVFADWLASGHGRETLKKPGVTVVMLEGEYQTKSDIGIEEVHGRSLLREISDTFENCRQTLKTTELHFER